MDRISAFGYSTDANGHRVFVDANLAAGVDGTDCDQVWLNGVQEELMALLGLLGIAPDSANNTQVLQAITGIGRRTQAYTTPGTYTFTAPYTGYFPVTVVGAGGGGSNCDASAASQGIAGGSGGAGGWGRKLVFLTQGQAVPVVVGYCPGPQANGTSSSFGAYISATGGQGSNFGSTLTSPRGMGGMCTGGDVNFVGNPGQDGQAGSLYNIGANGGAGPFGGAGAGAERGGGNGVAPGSGGGGSFDSQQTAVNYAGGTGAPGAVFVRY